MTSMTSIPVEADFTADDLEAMPDDGRRYELVDGQLLVTPSPTLRHQAVSTELLFRLRLAVPPGLRVLSAPMDVRLGPRLQVQPDLLVVRDEGLEGARVESVPLLAVEIASPGTRSRDRVLKRNAYEAVGIASYWLVDLRGPSITVLELREGRYEQIAVVEGEQPWTAELPYPVTVVAADLAR